MSNQGQGVIDFRSDVNIDNLTDEQKKVWNEALFKSKGKSNSRFGAKLVVAGATSDEVARLTANTSDYPAVYVSAQQRLTKEGRAMRQLLKEVPDFWDTIKGRVLKEKHGSVLERFGIDTTKKMPVTKLDAKLSRYYILKSYSILNVTFLSMREQCELETDARASKWIEKIELGKLFEPLMGVKFFSGEGEEDKTVSELLDNTVYSGDGRIDGYDSYRKYEIDSLANMDEDITASIRTQQLLCDVINRHLRWRLNYPYDRKTINALCVTEGFYGACDEMGIAGVTNMRTSGRRHASEATCLGIMKHVIKMGGTYRRLVKNGFAESIARETVLTEINEAIANRASHPYIRFYPRNDRKDTPPEEKKKVEKSKKSSGGSRKSSGSKKVLTVDEYLAAAEIKEGGDE